MEKDRKQKSSNYGTFKAGAVSLAFLIIGYQSALFMNRAAELHIQANRDHPDTVYIALPRPEAMDGSAQVSCDEHPVTYRKQAPHSPAASEVRSRNPGKPFRFNPNTVSEEELIELGFSPKQAASIANYRSKGGKFRRKSDFARSFVVSEDMFARLEDFIDIPLTDINTADSAAFDALPGIGPYFAAAMVRHRESLGGYSYPEQLMDIYRFDSERYDALKDLITCSKPKPYHLWDLPEEELRRHPYIRNLQAARGIALYRKNTPREKLSVEDIVKAGILDSADASKLSRCIIASPVDGD